MRNHAGAHPFPVHDPPTLPHAWFILVFVPPICVALVNHRTRGIGVGLLSRVWLCYCNREGLLAFFSLCP